MEKTRREFDDEREKIRMKNESTIRSALEQQQLEFDDNLEKKEIAWRAETEELLKKEREKVQRETEEQLNQLQRESDNLINKLELALSDLKNEKQKLSSELTSTVSKLEELEDHVYDLEESNKREKVSNSFIIWQLTTNTMLLKIKFKNTLQKMISERDVKENDIIQTHEKKTNELLSTKQNLSNNIMESFQILNKILKIITNYKSDILLEKKTLIKLLEKDMEHLNQERELLEAQKEKLEDEINELQEQVQDIESQIREHTQDSAVQNGRINVTHARKKRKLDNELERLIDLIEQRRERIMTLETRIGDKGREKDEKESEMVDLERMLVGILVEQQRLVLSQVEGSKSVEERSKSVVRSAGITWSQEEGNNSKSS